MPPAEGGVGVDDEVGRIAGFVQNILEGGSAQGVEAADGEIEDLARAYIERFLVHQVADVEYVDGFTLLPGELRHGIEVRFLFDTNLSGHNRSHRRS